MCVRNVLVGTVASVKLKQKLHPATQTLSRKGRPSELSVWAGRWEKGKGQGSLEGATELININYINMHNIALAHIKGSTTESIFHKELLVFSFLFNSCYIFTDIIKIIF